MVNDTEKVKSLISILPKNLQEDMRKDIHSNLLKKYDLFLKFSNSSIDEISSVMEEKFFLPNEKIF